MIAVIFTADQWSKGWVRSHFLLGESQAVFPPYIHLTYIENSGAAFGMLSGNIILLTTFTLLFLGFFVWYLWRKTHRPMVLKLGFSLVVAGALGNLWDRITKGSVTDMIDFRVWPIFNIADIAVSVGFVLLVIFLVRYDEED